MGFEVVPHGITYTSRLSDETLVVIYTDEYAHEGEGKEVGFLGNWRHVKPARLFSVYIHGGETSYRLLRIGRKTHLFSFSTRSDWRSSPSILNSREIPGDIIEIQIPPPRPDDEERLPPIWAVDFVKSDSVATQGGVRYAHSDSVATRGRFYAIDFNTRPQIPAGLLGETMAELELVVNKWRVPRASGLLGQTLASNPEQGAAKREECHGAELD